MIPKYRVWDKELQTMLDVSLIDFLKGVLVGEHWEFGETNFMSFDEIVIMQSTGLFDKTNTEIFEGDILEIQGMKMIVRFGSYKYIEASKSGNHTIGIMCDGLGFYVECLNVAAPDDISPFEPETLKESVVIGNIYKNPKLLQEVDD